MAFHSSSLRSQGMELLIDYQKSPSIPTRNHLVQMNMGLVRKVAHHLSRQCSEPYDDLEQIGSLGLIRAIERFQPSQGCAFSSFATPYIRGEILHFLRDRGNTVRIPRRWQDLSKAEKKANQQLVRDLGRQPTAQEIVDRLNISIEEWQEMHLAVKNRLPLSLDAMISHQKDSLATLGEMLPASTSCIDGLEEEQRLKSVLDQLEDKQRFAIEHVFLKGLSRKEVAERAGVSPMTVTRRIRQGINQITNLLKPQQLQVNQ